MEILVILESKFIKIFKIGNFPLFQEAHNAINFVIYHEVRNRNYIFKDTLSIGKQPLFQTLPCKGTVHHLTYVLQPNSASNNGCL